MNRLLRRVRNWLGLALLAALAVKTVSYIIDPLLAVLAGLFAVSLLLAALTDL